jgi:hypothetical protein
VEEMAIASSLPVPPVYLLNEWGINAFAAGWTPQDAVIGITRGALKYLNRDELQGVVAHEFSHILNGDMQFNIRLTGILHGILLLAMIGYYLMRVSRFGRSSSSEKGGSATLLQLGLGMGLLVIGGVGAFFGNWIKAVVSRQREYLADASAVQFTRNPSGIAGALGKIGGFHAGAVLHNPAAPEFSHAYFAEGVSSFLESFFGTHPPLDERIRRIDPSWDGKFTEPQPDPLSTPDVLDEKGDRPRGDERARQAAAIGMGVAAAGGGYAAGGAGKRSEARTDDTKQPAGEIPEALRAETAGPDGVRALMYAMVLHADPELRKIQREVLDERADPEIQRKAEELVPGLSSFDHSVVLPLLDLCLPALRELALPQYQAFRNTLTVLMYADKRIDFREWVIQKVLLVRSDEAHGLRKRPAPSIGTLGDVKTECELLLSLAAYAVNGSDGAASAAAFDAGRKTIGMPALNMLPREQVSLRSLDGALNKLERLSPALKPRLLKACAACIAAGGNDSAAGTELLRAVAVSLGENTAP